ncbi:MAG: class I SAM-dependent methyltransferase [Solirubrobacterales bacterium]
MSGRRQGWRRYLPRQVSYNARLLLATLRNMRAGLRFADRLPAETGAPAVVQSNGSNPFETYFDAVTEGPGVWKWRHYFPIYDRHLSKFIDHEVHVVEIGIYSGGSLPMWRSAFGQGCQVYGIDIDPACLAHEQEGVRVFIGDQADPGFWERFIAEVPRIDVVIDDGGHQAHQQITSLSCLLPHMAMGGVYIVEDALSSHHQFHSFVDGATRRLSDVYENAPVAPVHQHIDSVHRYPQLTVLEKPERPVQPFDSPKHGTVWEPETHL